MKNRLTRQRYSNFALGEGAGELVGATDVLVRVSSALRKELADLVDI